MIYFYYKVIVFDPVLLLQSAVIEEGANLISVFVQKGRIDCKPKKLFAFSYLFFFCVITMVYKII